MIANSSNEEPLLIECSIKQHRKQQQARKKRTQILLNGSRLVGNFSEFLASRNVINAYSRYDKIVNSEQANAPSAHEANKQLLYERALIEQQPLRYNQQQQQRQLEERAQELICGSFKKTKRTRFLLKALISRNQINRTSLLISLLRAPIVLAALFSLLLVASIMVLYTMSFHHNHCHNNQRLSFNQSQSSPNEPEPHVISSRHLLQSSKVQSSANGTDNNEHTTIDSEGFNRALTVQTECGAFIGAPEDRAIVFKGIPYASPPLGSRRWTRPRPVWLDPKLCRANETSEAREYKKHCAQLSPVTRRFSGHEDCLYLDIHAPKLDPDDQVKKLPVMVYIHGGFLSYGSSGHGEQVNWMKARPSGQLASELDVVLVSFNYRLQALGFMTLAQLAQNNGPDGSEGNYGLWDQLAALNWIKRNIESFGGDPDNIVLFGPDAASSLPLAMIGRLHWEQKSDHLDNNNGKTLSGDANQALHAGDLFRAVWLTNPTVFYELPYELANQHYQRLFLNQSPCQRGGETDANISRSKQSDELRDCLMSLSSEQVVRYYLAKDDPSYRLDDQNSLPIHGIFAEQFVTVDRELVQDSYPFGRRTADSYTTKVPSYNPISGTRTLPAEAHYASAGKGTAAMLAIANDTAANNWQPDNYNDNRGLGKEKWRQRRKPDLLLGSTAQAVEYWPCPRNLDQWTWEDFKRYVAASLNSFISDTYKRACELYRVPSSAELAANVSGPASAGPKETYLTMVSDIRQTCAINELAESLQSGGHQVQRYIIKQRPSRQRNNERKVRASGDPFNEPQTNKLPEFAFHTWDLLAFFGFHFEPDFEPNEQDLQFQARIRHLVREFVNGPKIGDTRMDRSYLVFEEGGREIQVADYKEEECGMWRRHLSRSYAWVS